MKEDIEDSYKETYPTEAEIIACQETQLLESATNRQYQYKEYLTVALSRFLIFTILFSTHFPFFLKTNRENN
jgi:hypothetical protein